MNDSFHKTKYDNRPIGIFDSGIGGLTVLKEIRELLPNENIVYFGDNGRAPYGTKSHDTIVKYALEDMKFLLHKKVKMIVIACNTASAHAYDEIVKHADVPVVEVITPGAIDATTISKNKRIGIIATKATVNSGVYRKAVENEFKQERAVTDVAVFQKACPLFVSLAEEGWWDNDIAYLTAQKYLDVFDEEKIDTLILGCTHYPLLIPVISRVLGKNVNLINAGKSVAEKVKKLLNEKNMYASLENEGVCKFYTSDDPEAFASIMGPFIGDKISDFIVRASAE